MNDLDHARCMKRLQGYLEGLQVMYYSTTRSASGHTTYIQLFIVKNNTPIHITPTVCDALHIAWNSKRRAIPTKAGGMDVGADMADTVCKRMGLHTRWEQPIHPQAVRFERWCIGD